MPSVRAGLIALVAWAAFAFATGVVAQERVRPSGDILTPSERAYLTTKGEVRFCIDPDWMPFEAIRDGQVDGMTSDYQQLFSKHLGVPFRLVPTLSWAQSQEFAKAGMCDILPMVPITKERMKDLTFSDAYLSYSVGIISTNRLPFISSLADLADYPVGIVRGYSTWEYAKNNFPQNTFVEVSGIEDGLLKVSSGKITAFLIAVPVAVHNIKELGLSNLKVAGHIQVKKELRIGVSRKVPELAPIIDKLMASLSKEDIDGVYRKWVAVHMQSQPNYDVIVMVAVGLFLVLTIVVWWNRKLSRLNKEITEREAELQAAKDQAEQYLRIAGTVIVALDKEGRVQLINRAGAQLIGKSAREIRGMNWIDFIPKAQQAAVRRTFNMIMAGSISPVEHFENEILDCHGNTHLISWHNTLVSNADDEIIGTLSSGEDITETRKAETELLKAKVEAEQANMAKTRFLAAASHDLRQPAQAMNLFIHALRQAEGDPGKLDMLRQLEQSSHDLSALLTSLLDISRLDAGAVKVEKQDVNITQLFSTLLEEYENTEHENHVQFDCVPCSLTVHTDPTLLGIVLRNLISNAFTHAQTKRILLGCRRRPNGFIDLQVWDAGIGIDDVHIGQIFNEFYQIDNEARHRDKGLGLGLAIVKRISELLDLDVSVQSAPGQGTMFSIRIPVVADAAQPSAMAFGMEAEPGVSGHTIVVIEDEEQVRKALTLVLETSGNTIIGLDDAQSTESLARIDAITVRPDIIVADYRLASGHTGVDAIHKIRQVLGADIPAVLLTGDTAPERIQEALQSGFPLLHKPVHPYDLLEQIARSLENS